MNTYLFSFFRHFSSKTSDYLVWSLDQDLGMFGKFPRSLIVSGFVVVMAPLLPMLLRKISFSKHPKVVFAKKKTFPLYLCLKMEIRIDEEEIELFFQSLR